VKYLRKDLDSLVSAAMGAQNIPMDQLEEAREFFESRFITEFIQKTLLLNEAKAEGIIVTEEDRKEMMVRIEPMLEARNMTLEEYFQGSPFGEEFAREEFEKGLIFEKLLKVKIRDQITIDDAEVEKIIAELTEQNAATEEANKNMESKEVKRAKLEDLKKQLDAGADFAELAQEHSVCPSGKQDGGNLGTFARGQMVKPFEDAAFAQEVGKVGDIVETQYGYHLILVTAKSPATEAVGDIPAAPENITASHILIGFDREAQVRPVPSAEEVRAGLTDQQARPLAQAYLNQLKEKANIESIISFD